MESKVNLKTISDMSSKIQFTGNILLFGAGAICQCALPMVLDRIDISPEKITVVEMDEKKKEAIQSSLDMGVKFLVKELKKENLHEFLSSMLTDGDILLDLAWEIDTVFLLSWCHEHGVLYLNTSLEVWDPCGDAINNNPHPRDRTLYQRHVELHEAIHKFLPLPNGDKGPTGIFEHGANPGLVSHLVKKALSDLTEALLADPKVDESRKTQLKLALDSQQFNRLCQLTGTKVIHVSERDTQVSNVPKVPNEFVNTWSIAGFYEEGIAPVELCWGTHEKWIPKGTHFHDTHVASPWRQSNAKPHQKGHCIALSQPGLRSWARSYCPEDGGDFIGILMPHGECITMGDHLTVYDANGNVEFRPSMYFVYCPCDDAVSSMREVEMRGFKINGMPQRIMTNEIVQGKDKLGILLLGHDYDAWWTGSLLSIEEARRIAPGQNATSLQVASGVIGGLLWAIKNPREGVCLPEQLPWKEIVDSILMYLGEMRSGPVAWTPLKDRLDLYAGWNTDKLDDSDPWQFCNFMVPGCPSANF